MNEQTEPQTSQTLHQPQPTRVWNMMIYGKIAAAAAAAAAAAQSVVVNSRNRHITGVESTVSRFKPTENDTMTA